jgi:hypothetical protein
LQAGENGMQLFENEKSMHTIFQNIGYLKFFLLHFPNIIIKLKEKIESRLLTKIKIKIIDLEFDLSEEEYKNFEL